MASLRRLSRPRVYAVLFFLYFPHALAISFTLTVAGWIHRIALGGHYEGGSEAHATFSIARLHPVPEAEISFGEICRKFNLLPIATKCLRSSQIRRTFSKTFDLPVVFYLRHGAIGELLPAGYEL